MTTPTTRQGRRPGGRRGAAIAAVPILTLLLQGWDLWDPGASLKAWFMDSCTMAWKYTASLVLTSSGMDEGMWATATDGLNKLAGVMAFVTVAAGAYGVIRAAASQDIGAVLSAATRTVIAWPLTVLMITLVARGSTLAGTLTESILQSSSLAGGIPDIDATALDPLGAVGTIVIALCIILSGVVLMLMMAARNFLLIFAVVIAAIPIMLQGWATMRPLLGKWTGWIVGIILMQPVMALCIWITCKLMVVSTGTMSSLIAIVGMILASVFPFSLIKQIADFIPGTLGMMRAGSAGAGVVAAAGSAVALGVQSAAGLGTMAAQATSSTIKSGSGQGKAQGASPSTGTAETPDFKPNVAAAPDGDSPGNRTQAKPDTQSEATAQETPANDNTRQKRQTTVAEGALKAMGDALTNSGFPSAGATAAAVGTLYGLGHHAPTATGGKTTPGATNGPAAPHDGRPDPGDGGPDSSGPNPSDGSPSGFGSIGDANTVPDAATAAFAPETEPGQTGAQAGNDIAQAGRERNDAAANARVSPPGPVAGAESVSGMPAGDETGRPETLSAPVSPSMGGGEASQVPAEAASQLDGAVTPSETAAVPSEVTSRLGVPAAAPAPASTAGTDGSPMPAPISGTGAPSMDSAQPANDHVNAPASASTPAMVPAQVASELGVIPAATPAQPAAAAAPAGVPVVAQSMAVPTAAPAPTPTMADTPLARQDAPAAPATPAPSTPSQAPTVPAATPVAPQAVAPAQPVEAPNPIETTAPAAPPASESHSPAYAVSPADDVKPKDLPGDSRTDIGGGRSIKVTRRGFHKRDH